MRGVKIVVGVLVVGGAMTWCVQAAAESSRMARLTDLARKAGLPTSDAELAALVGPDPSPEVEVVFKDMTEIRDLSGLTELDRQAADPIPIAKRLSVAGPFLESAKDASLQKSFRFTRNWKSFPTVPTKELNITNRAVSLLCSRAFQSARTNQPGVCLSDLETAGRLVEISGKDPSIDGAMSLTTGRRRVFETLCNSLGVGQWGLGDLIRAEAFLKSLDHDIDPQPFLVGQFAMHWWMCDNADQVFQTMKSDGGQVDSVSWMTARMPGAATRLKAQMVEATVATQRLFADDSLSLAQRIVKADAMESDPRFAPPKGESFFWFVSPQPAMFALAAVEDSARRRTASAVVEALILRAKGARDVAPTGIQDPFTGRAIAFRRTKDGFAVMCDPSELNESLKSSDSILQEVRVVWPYNPDNGVRRMGMQGRARPSVN